MSYKLKPNGTTLVIVESPAKCKKIESYLGPGYKCIASFGHIRELTSLDDIDMTKQCATKFHINAKKKPHVDLLKREIKNADDIILATDDDREGEAIAWHICSLFNLPIETTKRIIFHEITEKAILEAVRNPSRINMPVVFSQQARQILDLIVGFKISPLLWKYISKKSENSLSAGRCQTPALRLVYENQQEIDNNPGTKIYNTIGYFTNKHIAFDLNKQFVLDTDVTDFLEETVNMDHIFSRTTPVKVFKKQPSPFTTSKLQQVASNELHFSPKETMSLCQTLYEQGYITYMRTDSKKYCRDFVDSAKQYIIDTYHDERYISHSIEGIIHADNEDESSSKEINNKKTGKDKEKKEEDKAHEAIRITDIWMKELPEVMKPREKKMYKLIWENSIASCMSEAEYYSITANITAPMNTIYSSVQELVFFLGWQEVYKKPKDKGENKEYSYLLQLKEGIIITYQKIISKISLKDKKQHYTEARLVSLLEDKGIGRPSTFASLIDKILERGYVKKEDIIGKTIMCKDFELEDDILNEINQSREFGNEKGKLVIQPTGILVIEFLMKHFELLFNYDYTGAMEENLDEIVKGKKVWHELCNNCLLTVENLCSTLKEEDKEKCEFKIDESHSYIIGKHGPVIKCTKGKDVTFLSVKPNIDLKELENNKYTLEQLLQPINTLSLGQYEGTDVIIKKGKFGLYASWKNGESTVNLSSLGNRPIENIKWEEVLPLLEERKGPLIPTVLRRVTNDISIRSGKFGDYLFYKTDKMKKPQFLKLQGFTENHLDCSLDILKAWIKDKYKVE